MNWIGSAKLQARTGESGITGNFYNGLQEFEDMAFLLHVLRRDDMFVDVGANAGAWTVLASKVIGATTAAFEPVPETFGRLFSNVKLNGLQDLVELHKVAISDESGVLWFSTDKDSMNRVVRNGAQNVNTVAVPVNALDNIIQQSITLIKIDVEGFEVPVLKGAERHLADNSLLAAIVETNGSGYAFGYSDKQIIEQMQRFGFQPFSYDPWNRELSNIPRNMKLSGNTVFVRDVDRVRERVKQSKPICVNGTYL